MQQITVKGVGRTSEKPDTVEINFTLSTVRKEYADCAAAAAGELEKLRAAVIRAGLKKSALKTAAFNLSARYDSVPGGKGERVFAGYECAHRLTLRFRLNAALLEKVLAEVGDCGAFADFSVRFTLKNMAKVREKLIRQAMADAADKAAILADAAGRQLGELLSVEYGAASPNPYSRTEYARAAQPRLLAAGLSIEPEDVENTDTVTAVYSLAP